MARLQTDAVRARLCFFGMRLFLRVVCSASPHTRTTQHTTPQANVRARFRGVLSQLDATMPMLSESEVAFQHDLRAFQTDAAALQALARKVADKAVRAERFLGAAAQAAC